VASMCIQKSFSESLQYNGGYQRVSEMF